VFIADDGRPVLIAGRRLAISATIHRADVMAGTLKNFATLSSWQLHVILCSDVQSVKSTKVRANAFVILPNAFWTVVRIKN